MSLERQAVTASAPPRHMIAVVTWNPPHNRKLMFRGTSSLRDNFPKKPLYDHDASTSQASTSGVAQSAGRDPDGFPSRQDFRDRPYIQPSDGRTGDDQDRIRSDPGPARGRDAA